MKLPSWTLIACIGILLLASGAFAQQVAITIDDLPSHGALPPGMTRTDVPPIAEDRASRNVADFV